MSNCSNLLPNTFVNSRMTHMVQIRVNPLADLDPCTSACAMKVAWIAEDRMGVRRTLRMISLHSVLHLERILWALEQYLMSVWQALRLQRTHTVNCFFHFYFRPISWRHNIGKAIFMSLRILWQILRIFEILCIQRSGGCECKADGRRLELISMVKISGLSSSHLALCLCWHFAVFGDQRYILCEVRPWL